MLKFKKITALFTVCIVLAVLCCRMTTAQEVIGNDLTGSLSITMNYKGQAVNDGELILFQVARLYKSDEQNAFVLTDDFSDCGILLTDISFAEFADKCAVFAAENNVEGMSKEIGADGKVYFDNLSTGLYLIAQKSVTLGDFSPISPFLVSIPEEKDGKYIYDIDASPKIELKKNTPPNEDITKPKPDTLLPQTGQLNWPIPLLATAGLVLLILGWHMCLGKVRTNEK